MSFLNTQLMLMQEHITEARARGEEVMYYALFSDSIFSYHACITHCHEPPLHGVLPERLAMENFATNSIRVSIEWTYGDVIILFHVLHSRYQKKYFLPDFSINQVMAQQL
jgi:hypothetical protein